MSDRDTVQVLLRRQRSLADFGDFALAYDDLDKVLTEACRLVAEALQTQRAKVLELQNDGQCLFVRAGVGWNPAVVGHVKLPMSEHSSESYAINAREPVTCPDVSLESRFEIPAFMRNEGVAAFANVPIFLPGQKAYGLLQVDATTLREFRTEDTEFLRSCSSILGPVIDRLFKVNALRSSEERFRLTVEAATDYAIFLSDPEDRITDWLPGAEAIFGWSAQEAVGQPSALIFSDEDRTKGLPEQEISLALENGHACNIRPQQHKNGSPVIIDGIVRVLRDEHGRALGFIRIGQDVTERRQADERLRTLMEGIPQLVWRSNDRGYWTWAGPQWLTFTGQDPEDAQERGWLDAVHPEDHDAVLVAWECAHHEGQLDTEFRIRRISDGQYLWHHTRSTPVRDEMGRITEWLGTSTDVQSLKEMQERQAVLVAELQHRTRNLLGVVRSIATQTMASTGPTPVFLEHFATRLSALSRVQGLLSRAQQEPITLDALLRLELDALGATEGKHIRLEGPSVSIRPSLVQMLALGFHELATNARKYGALSGKGGHLEVKWRLEDNAVDRALHIVWREEGIDHVPTLSAEQQSGYGRRLIEKALPYTLGAETTYNLEPEALLCTITLPLDRAQFPEEL